MLKIAHVPSTSLLYIYTYIYMWKTTKEVCNQYVDGWATPLSHPSKDSQPWQLMEWHGYESKSWCPGELSQHRDC